MTRYLFTFFMLCIYVLAVGQGTTFEYISKKHSTVIFKNELKENKDHNIFIYDNFYAGAGVGIGDINNDGLQDLYFCGNQVGDKLYLNKGDFKFQDITKSSGISSFDIGWSSSISMVDVNKDGLLDLFVTKELYDDKPAWRKDKLYINNGDLTFTEMAEEVGLGDTLRTRGAVFFDYDLDQDLDVFLLHQPPNPGKYSKYKPLSDNGQLLDNQYAPRLYENRTGKFYDVSKQANVLNPGFANAVAVADLNHDGYADIIVANDFEAPDAFYVNQGDGTFLNQANEAFPHTSFYSMGIDIADFDNDMWYDVLMVDMVAEDNYRLKSNMSGMAPEKFWRIVDRGWNYQYMYNVLLQNNQNTTFSDIAKLSGIDRSDWSWSPLIADFDNDGLKDVFISNGLFRDIRNTDANKKIQLYIHKKIQAYLANHTMTEEVAIWDIVSQDEIAEIYPSKKIKNKIYKNKGSYAFKDVSDLWGLSNAGFSHGAAYGDLDNDGDLDLVINNVNEEASLLRNNSKNNFLRLSLIDAKHQPVLGAKARIITENGAQLIEHTHNRGMYSNSEALLHFGLGNSSMIDSVEIYWPNGTYTLRVNVPANQTLTIDQSVANHQKAFPVYEPERQFVEVTDSFPISYAHIENECNDFDFQVLLPHKMSQFGPAITAADINHDGLDDLFIGGAAGQSAVLYLQTSDKQFQPSSQELWHSEKSYEDIDATFVDMNADGHLDLYVVSGGNTHKAYSSQYSDRLYLNDGMGRFSVASVVRVGNQSGSCVRAADFDKDGKMDLFVGSRHLPHHYPEPPSSILLQNNNGSLVDRSNIIAPELKNMGMVTDASWCDYDNDNDLDLIIVGEWMGITILENDNGRLQKVATALDKEVGWWFSIDHADFDNDGDQDLIAGNLGLNYKYQSSEESPFDIYYNDFDNNGSKDIVLGYYENNKHFPLRGFSCSSEQIPALKKEIGSYNIFANLDIGQVYGENQLDQSLHYTATTFASTYFENVGNGEFIAHELPRDCQVSNINDFLITDFDADGYLDILATENLYASEVETPRNDAGTGLLLKGDGKGNFTCTSGFQSGLFNSGDAKKIICINECRELLIANNNDRLRVFKKKTYPAASN